MEKEGFYPEKKYAEEREKFMGYLLERAGDENYPENITTAAFRLHAELLKYPNLQIHRKESRLSTDSVVYKVLDRLYKQIIELRQMLLRANLGDSEFAHVLATVHENLK